MTTTPLNPFIEPSVSSDKHLRGKYKKAWVEDSFIFEESVGPQITTHGTRSYLGVGITPKNLLIFTATIILGFSLIGLRIIYLQLWKGDHYHQLAETNRLRRRPIVPERGIIYDRNGQQLVQNIPNFSLAIIPQDFPRDPKERQRIIKRIADLTEVEESEITTLLRRYSAMSYDSLTIKENLDYDTALRLYLQNANLPGIIIEKGTKRAYGIINHSGSSTPLLSLSHILGYTGKMNDEELKNAQKENYFLSDTIGKAGVEKQYESSLRGKSGTQYIEVNATGHEQQVISEDAPVHGADLTLTIDSDAQIELENLIKKDLAQGGWKRASGIAMDPNTGAILAMVSWPSFDNNDFAGGISRALYKSYDTNPDKPLFNRSIHGTYPSGSTVKLVIATAALEEGIITRTTAFLSTGGLDVGGHLFKDWLAGGHGITNVQKALAWSVNTFFYYVGGGYENFTGLGVDRIDKYLTLFGLGSTTGIDLPGESSGFVPTKEWKEVIKKGHWYVGDTYNLSIGQGDLEVTPLQVAVWTAAVANGGSVVVPHVVRVITDAIKKTEGEIEFKPRKTGIASAETLQIVRQGMRQCVTDGSCKLLQSLPFAAGGKTGTAQWSSHNPEHAWFTGFAPLEHPQIVITILVEEGKEGSRASMPVARDFLAWWGARYLK